MALPTLTKTWQHNEDNLISPQGSALADNRAMWRAWKNAITGFGSSPWVVLGSSDSVTGAIDGVDRWSADNKLVWGGAGNAHSWILLKQTGIASNYQMLWSCTTLSATGQAFKIALSRSAGFTGGSATADPTATDQITPQYSGGTGGGNIVGVATDVAIRWNAQMSTDGACTRIWAYSAGALLFLPMGWEKLNNATTGTPGFDNTGVAWGGSVQGATIGQTISNSITANCSINNTEAALPTVASEVDGNWIMQPMAVWSATVSDRGRFGTMFDMWLTSTNLANGSADAALGFMQINAASGMMVPWGGGTFHTS